MVSRCHWEVTVLITAKVHPRSLLLLLHSRLLHHVHLMLLTLVPLARPRAKLRVLSEALASIHMRDLKVNMHAAHLNVLVVIVLLVALNLFILLCIPKLFLLLAALIEALKNARASHVALGRLEGNWLLLVDDRGVSDVARVLALLAVPSSHSLAGVVGRGHLELSLGHSVTLLGRCNAKLVEVPWSRGLVSLVEVVH